MKFQEFRPQKFNSTIVSVELEQLSNVVCLN